MTQRCSFQPSAHLRPVVNANLDESTLLVVEDAVVGVLPVAVIVELHASREAFWVFGGHQNPAGGKRQQQAQRLG